ncbi:MGMT family protein [Alteromonas lipolytica]|uniref:Methylated-DNA-[protein]-cysteine S-methyltransferase DNA binding domain-containing protein n=1 Tax=Alteromonas lipolytica TaxID=1856405 RepID=A0A1E8FBM6_9ALTE|nr:MGMT family protein [Alteromonas lipolytica]OFI32903.1 hypothetical protein BFC17_01105 [Alteromonas lipolytica]GGF64341.1 methylated-DNA--protein-cysteine methyltransferase [Alteromonas lipolytica]
MIKHVESLSETDKLTPAERIWHTVRLIPPGKVAAYGKIADLAGLPGRARYVGYCLRNLPDSLTLPWHRVLLSSGQIAFKAGTPQAIRQQALLENEHVRVSNNRVNLTEFGWQPSLDVLLHELVF